MNFRSVIHFFLNAVGLGLLVALLLYLISPQLFKPVAPPAPLPVSKPPVTVSYAEAVRRAAPAVVSIITAQAPDQDQFQESGRAPQPDIGLGSGVVLRSDGYILTNDHVIAGADAIAVTLQDGRQLRADVVGRDKPTDLAVLKIALTGMPTIPLADNHPVQVGDVAMAIGNPIGIGQTVTLGIVSATNRGYIGRATYEDFIQTDAAITYGNSGGALINAYGELIGINSAFLSRVGGGISFAIPTNQALSVLDQILKNGRVIRGWLGLTGQDLLRYPNHARDNGLTELKGIVIEIVDKPSPAFDGGLQRGDILTHIDGQEIYGSRDTMKRIAEAKPGAAMSLQFVRRGQAMSAKVVIAERPAETGT